MPKGIYRWEQKSWAGGISDDKFMGNPSTFQYSKNIDIFSNPKGICLAQDTDSPDFSVISIPQQSYGCTFGNMCPAGDDIYTFMFGVTNEQWVYRKNIYDNSDSSWTPVEIDSYLVGTASERITGIYEYNGNLYVFTSESLYSVAVSDAADDDWASLAEVDTTNHVYKTFAKEIFNKLYYGHTHTLKELDDSTGSVIITEKLEFPSDEYIKYITFDGNMIKIYTVQMPLDTTSGYTSTRVLNSYVYTWYGTSASYNQRLPIPSIEITGVAQLYGVDYFVGIKSGGKAGGADDSTTDDINTSTYDSVSLYMTDGSSFRKVIGVLPSNPEQFRVSTALRGDNCAADSYNTLAVKDDFIYILGRNEIYKYGKKFDSAPAAWVPILSNVMDESTAFKYYNEIFAHYGKLFINYVVTGDLPPVRIAPGGYLGVTPGTALLHDKCDRATSGYLISRIFTDNECGKTKRFRRLEVSCIPLRANEEIRIYFRKDMANYTAYKRFGFSNTEYATDFVLVGTFNTVGASYFRIDDSDLLSTFNEFNTLEMKIQLVNISSPSTAFAYTQTPVVLEANVEYDYIYD